MFGNQKKNAPSSFGGAKKAPQSKNGAAGKVFGNLTASRKGADGQYEKMDIGVLFSDDGGETISGIQGKKGTDFEGVTFFINPLSSKENPKKVLMQVVDK